MKYNFIKLRIIHKIKKLIDRIESEWETFLILRDENLVQAIRRGERDFEKGECLDWEDVKKELNIKI